MRTTIELSDELRAKLLELAAERGEKGFSAVIQEAVEEYLARLRRRKEAVASAIDVLGTLDEEAAEEMKASIDKLRQRWR